MVVSGQIITKSAEETQKLGEKVGYTKPRLICLWGELGSGKTTFIQGLARGIGIPSRLLSPTFIIVRRYGIPHTRGYLYHMDLYRIKDGKDVVDLGFSEMLKDPESITAIEWPEKLGALLPKERLDVRFSVLPSGNHEITIS